VLATQDLSKGVIVGVILSGVFFAAKVANLFRVTLVATDDGTEKAYVVEGQICSPRPKPSSMPSTSMSP
jgi:SulP family sulfate permease